MRAGMMSAGVAGLAFALILTVAVVARGAESLVVDSARNEIRLSGVVQMNPDRPVHGRWAKKSTAFVGVRGGSEDEDFIVLLDGDRAAIYAAARALGWQTGRRYDWRHTLTRRGFSKRTELTDYMTGDPLLCALEFVREGETRRIPLEEVVRCRIKIDGVWVEVPYTPHFVFTGAGEENGIDSGCLICPSDCVGGLMTDNSVPVQTEAQQFLIDWDKLPAAGSPITVLLRSIR